MGSVRRSGGSAFFLYLGLNVIVSLVTILAVLSLFDRRQPEPTQVVVPTQTVDVADVLASAVPTASATLVPTPTPYVYRVKPNDTLFGIALELGVSLTDLMEINDLTETSVLDVGQVLQVPTPASGSTAPSATPAASATAPSAEAPRVEIVGVTAAGVLGAEAVQLVNGGGVAAMAGWTLDDGGNQVYVFPDFTLHRGAVSIHTRAGVNTVIDLFWGLDRALWGPGKTVRLRDASGQVQSTFNVPPG